MLPYGEVGQRKSIPQGPAGSLKSGAFFGGLADTFLSVERHSCLPTEFENEIFHCFDIMLLLLQLQPK